MFKKLKRMNFVFLSLFLALFLIIGNTVIIVVLKKSMTDFSISLIEHSFSLYEQNILSAMSLCEETANLFTMNPKVISSLKNGYSRVEIQSILNSIKVADPRIIGATVYGKDRQMSTDNLSVIPLAETGIDLDFEDTDEPIDIWVNRRDKLPLGSFTYNGLKDGVFTKIKPVLDFDDNVIAFIFIDIDARALVSTANLEKNNIYRNITTTISSENSSGKVGGEGEKAKPEMEENNFFNFIISQHIPESNIYINHKVETNIESSLRRFYLLIMLINFVIVLYAIFYVRLITQSILEPLTDLYNKMKRYPLFKDKIVEDN